MKSMLHEAPTVIKAIEKAWTDSGQPSEFTIKVLETGETSFLWFSKHPAIISMTYDPKKQLKKTDVPKEKPAAGQTTQSSQFKRQGQHQSPSQTQQAQPSGQKYQDNRQQRPTQQTQTQPGQQLRQQAQTQQTSQQMQGDQPLFERTPLAWIDEWIETIDKDLKDIMVVMGIDTPFTIQADKKTLHINFTKNILATPEEERLLFISLSYLLIQFLKKRFKKKLRGFHLLIKSKQIQTNDTHSNSTIG
ncbi:MAG: hypothetical protein ABH827_01100 [bacterium]